MENPVDLTTLVKWGSRYGEVEWNNLVGYFMIVGSLAYEGLYKYNGTNTQYELANTQLNTTSEDIYGNNVVYTNIGKINGTLQNTDNLTLEQLNVRINLYNDLSYLELNENVTDISSIFNNLTIVPNIDTSNVTNMCRMFYACNSLKCIPDYNTSKVINMSDMFHHCYNLVSIPNFDTSNVTDMSGMFAICRNLADVPEFNTSNVTNITSIFSGCDNLNNISLNNIANSLPNASQVQLELIRNTGIYPNKLSFNAKNILFNKGYLDCDQNTNGWSTKYNINGNLYDRGEDFDRYASNLSDIINQYNTSAITSINIDSVGTDNGILFVLPSFGRL